MEVTIPFLTDSFKTFNQTYFNNTVIEIDDFKNTAEQDFNSWKNIEQTKFEEWLKTLTEDLTVETNLVTYESNYTSLVDGETVIPINIGLYDKEHDNYSTPTCFIVNTNKTEIYDVEIELYDDYLE